MALNAAAEKLEQLIEETITLPSEDPDAKWLMDCILATAKEADVVQIKWYQRQAVDFER